MNEGAAGASREGTGWGILLEMCVRYDISGDHLIQWSRALRAWVFEEDWRMGLDTFPGYQAPILVPDWSTKGNPRITRARFGVKVVTSGSGKEASQESACNARDDSLSADPDLTKKTWRRSFPARRCLVPATAFFERDQIGTPQSRWMKFAAPDGGTLSLPGLYDPPDDESTVPRYAMITTRPNGVVAPIQDRMPVVLSTEDAERWMDEGTHVEDLLELLRPCPDEWLVMEPELLVSEHRRRATAARKQKEFLAAQDSLFD